MTRDGSSIGRGGSASRLAAMVAAMRASQPTKAGGGGLIDANTFDPAPRPYGPKGGGEFPTLDFDPAPPRFPVSPVLESIANPTAGNALTPNIIKGAGALASDLNLYTLTLGSWIPVTIDRPEIWIPQGFTEGIIWYSPNAIPKVGSAVGDLQKSTRFGVVYLASPGTWWLQYTGLGAATVTMLRIDAFQPGVVSRYLGEAGVHNCIATTASNAGYVTAPNVVLPTDGTVITLLAENRDRQGCTIQNNSVAGANFTGFRITHSSNLSLASRNPIASGNLGGPRGLLLPAGASITFSGDTNVKGNIRVCSQATTGMGTQLQLDVIEYT